MLGVPQVAGVRYHDRGNGAQPRDDLARFVEPRPWAIAGGEKAISHGEARILLDREEQLRHGLIEAPAEEMRRPMYSERRTDAGARAEAQRGLRHARSRDRAGPPNILRMPLMYQPRAKLGLSASARSTSAIMAPMSSPK